jgi:lipopolysaccharide transport system permease protein
VQADSPFAATTMVAPQEERQGGPDRIVSRSRATVPGIIKHLSILYGYRDLLCMWTLREVKVRYKQSVLGIAWAILQPLALMLVFTLVFSVIAQLPSDGMPYPIFSYVALLPWTFFSTALGFGIPSLVSNVNLVTKIYFPREILPIANVGAALADFLIASSLFMVMLMWYQIPFSWAFVFLPFLVLLQIVLTLGIVLPAAALNVFYRDIRFVIPLAVQVWLYATPVIYPLSLVPDRLRPLYALNPLVGIMDSYRRVTLYGQLPDPYYLGSSVVISCLLAVAGYAYFKHAEVRFADVI